MKNSKTYRLRVIVMLAILAVVAVGYFTAVGIGNACGIGFGSITLICPLGALLAMIAERTAIPMAVLSIVAVLVICIVLGKVYCAWACPVHFMSRFSRKGKRAKAKANELEPAPTAAAAEASGEAASPAGAGASADLVAEVENSSSASAACSSCDSCVGGCGKTKGMKIDSRHAVLASAIISTLIFGFPVFCLVCPVGLTFATVLLVMQLFAFGSTTWTVVVFPLIILAEIILLPRWCKSICPLGALWSLMSGLNRTFRPRINKQACLRTSQNVPCNRCEAVCPEGINLHNIAAGETTLNDCTKCRACADVCPEHAITFPFLPEKAPHESVKGGDEPCPSSKG